MTLPEALAVWAMAMSVIQALGLFILSDIRSRLMRLENRAMKVKGEV